VIGYDQPQLRRSGRAVRRGGARRTGGPRQTSNISQQSARLVEQCNAYRPFPDLAVNGKLTLPNIADVAGLAVAYDGYRLALDGREAPSSQGLSGDQQFFLSFAQMWRAKYREAALRRRG
jgi:putative endopeptidase